MTKSKAPSPTPGDIILAVVMAIFILAVVWLLIWAVLTAVHEQAPALFGGMVGGFLGAVLVGLVGFTAGKSEAMLAQLRKTREEALVKLAEACAVLLEKMADNPGLIHKEIGQFRSTAKLLRETAAQVRRAP